MSQESKSESKSEGRGDQFFRWMATVTMRESPYTSENTMEWLKDNTKRWAFQEECGESGYNHWQIAFILKKRLRLGALVKFVVGGPLHGGHFTPIKDVTAAFAYVVKEDTRVEGPWSSEEVKEPADIKGKTLWPFQQMIVDDCKVPCTDANRRKIQVVIDPIGRNGKSILRMYLRYHKIAGIIPFCSKNVEDVSAMVMDTPEMGAYVVDMPRIVEKKTERHVWRTVEYLKDGHVYDKRHHYRERIFAAPKVWCFTNQMPDLDCLSDDRWALWLVHEGRLIAFTPDRYAKLVKIAAKLKAEREAADKQKAKADHDPLDDLVMDE